MPLDATTPLDRSAAITDAFADLGHAGGTAMPKARGKRSTAEEAAWEYWIASLLARLAEARKDKAKRAAVAASVLPNHTANPFPTGTLETVYTDDLITIALKVVEQASRLDAAPFIAAVEKLGIPPAKLKRLVKKHTTSFSGAHIFTATLV